jgi:hypothetical protein
MHAKRTRDRKKMFFELSEQLIAEMEAEHRKLRDYLVAVRLISVDEARESEARSQEARRELARLKVKFAM